MGTARVKQPWINKGLAFSSRSMSRFKPASVRFGNHEARNSRTHSWESMVGLLDGKRTSGEKPPCDGSGGDAKSILRTQSRVAPLGKRATKWQGMERSVPQQPGKTRAPKSGAKSAVAPEQTACVRGGQKTPPFAGAKRRGRNREEAN